MNQESQTLSQSSSGRRSFPTSPEFEFWMVRNPSFPQPNLLSADELFVDGVLLPLHLLSNQNPSDPTPKSDPILKSDPEPDSGDGPKLLPNTMESSSSLTSSKRWNIFKKSEKKNQNPSNTGQEDREKEKKKEKKNGNGNGNGNGSTSAELNINIWPFSRSRSAGNAVSRPKLFPGAPATRKVNSAPCSRSNSAGESKSRKWPSSPNRAGVHLGRSSPVWQVRRGGSGPKTSEPMIRNAEKAARKDVKGLNLNVPICIGYRNPLSCRSDETSAMGVVEAGSSAAVSGGNRGNDNGGEGGGGGVSNSSSVNGNSSSVNLFSIRSLFTKKVH